MIKATRLVKAVIWDIDGTLIDSEPLHLKALLAVCAQYGVDISDLPDEHFVGVNLPGVWAALRQRFPSGLSIDEWINALNSVYATHAADLIQMSDAAWVVRQIHAQGIR